MASVGRRRTAPDAAVIATGSRRRPAPMSKMKVDSGSRSRSESGSPLGVASRTSMATTAARHRAAEVARLAAIIISRVLQSP